MSQNDKLVATEVYIKVVTPSGKVIVINVAEFYEIEDGKNASVKVHYDADEFRREFGIN